MSDNKIFEIGVDPKTLRKIAHQIPIRWMVQRYGAYKTDKKGTNGYVKGYAQITPYINARDVRERLNDILGIHNWQCRHYVGHNGTVFCELSINVKGIGWISKTDAGDKNTFSPEKAEASDSLKRAFYAWGFHKLYEYPEMIFIDAQVRVIPPQRNGDRPKVVGKIFNGKKELKTAAAISAYCNSLKNSPDKLLTTLDDRLDTIATMEDLKGLFTDVQTKFKDAGKKLNE